MHKESETAGCGLADTGGEEGEFATDTLRLSYRYMKGSDKCLRHFGGKAVDFEDAGQCVGRQH